MSTATATEPSTAARPGTTMTVLTWLRRAGITEERARMHLAAGSVRVDGRVVTDPDAALGLGSSVELHIRRVEEPGEWD